MDMSRLYSDIELNEDQVVERMNRIKEQFSDPIQQIIRLRRWLIDLADRYQIDQANLVAAGIHEIIADHGLDVDRVVRKITTHTEDLFAKNDPRRMLVVEEKHGNRYIKATTANELSLACLMLLKERFVSGYYEYESQRFREEGGNQLDIFQRKGQDPVEEARFILQAASDPRFLVWSGKRAYKFLTARAGHEYENIYFADLEQPEYRP